MFKSSGFSVALATFIVMPVVGQSTLMPNFSVPYRAFETSEKGVSVSFPGGAYGFEGVYGIGRSTFDLRFRGGILMESQSNDIQVMFGTEIRNRVITHSEEFPFDGAFVFGGGVQLGDVNTFAVPFGLSLGRRLDVEDSEVVIVPFVQPTGILVFGDVSDFFFSMGFGADFRLTRSFDLRLSLGLGDVDGLSVSAIWVQ